MQKTTKIAALYLLLASPVASYAIDSDNDGSDNNEEIFAGTDVSDPLKRPWWKSRIPESSSPTGLGDIDGDGISDFSLSWAHKMHWSTPQTGYVKVFSGATALEITTINGFNENDGMGMAVAPLGDHNSDGYDDFLVSSPYEEGTTTDTGTVRLISGVDFSVIYTVSGSISNEHLGRTLANIGDIDKDGFDDFAAGSFSTHYNRGQVKVFSGIDGSLIYTFIGESAEDYFGYAIAGGGDANADGYPDILISATWADVDYNLSGSVYVFSGKDGTKLQQVNGTKDTDRLGESLTWLGDVDLDSHDDFAAGAFSYNGSYSPGSVTVFSGGSSQQLYQINDSGTSSSIFGSQLVATGDVNQDGIPDFSASAGGPAFLGYRGRFYVQSGADGSLLYAFNGTSETRSLGKYFSTLNDLDGDNLPEFLIASDYITYIAFSKDMSNDIDGDFLLNAIDTDSDNDGIQDNYDLFPRDKSAAGDFDGDGIESLQDNCPTISNYNQLDNDNDRKGNVCDEDIDGDSYLNHSDAFPNDPAEWLDSDGDGVGNNSDAFPNDPNASIDTDVDGIDDILDEDDDGDGLTDAKEILLGLNSKLANTDGDGAPDGYEPLPPRSWSPEFNYDFVQYVDDDTFPHNDCRITFVDLPEYALPNETLVFVKGTQSSGGCPDSFVKNYGAAYPPDILSLTPSFNAESIRINTKWECWASWFVGLSFLCVPQEFVDIPVFELEPMDTDGDGIVDFDDDYPTDPNLPVQDFDTDGIGNTTDNCPNTANPGQSDNDNDGIGNACDSDIDGDDIDNALDTHPLNPIYFTDFDGDKLNAFEDNCPFVSNAGQSDSDNDGDGNACDDDLDGDGFNDALDSHPLNASLFTDFDRDAVNSHQDNCPFNKNPGQSDNDGDGLGNACDPDVDGDGVDDVSDNYPRNPNLW